MLRWVGVALAIIAAAAAGLFAGYVRWGPPSAPAARGPERVAIPPSASAHLHREKEELEQRLQQVTKEQERLAQENQILRQQRTTQQLLGGTPGALPDLPPK